MSMEEQNIQKQLNITQTEGKRCLMVLHRFWPFLGGSERQFLKWAKVLDEKAVKTDVFTTNVWDNDFFYFPQKKYIKENKAKLGKNINIRRFRVFHLPKPECSASIPVKTSRDDDKISNRKSVYFYAWILSVYVFYLHFFKEKI